MELNWAAPEGNLKFFGYGFNHDRLGPTMLGVVEIANRDRQLRVTNWSARRPNGETADLFDETKTTTASALKGPPMWARLLFTALILVGFYGALAVAFFFTDTEGQRADAALKMASALGPLLGVVTGAMATFFFTEQERQVSATRTSHLEQQAAQHAEARRLAEAGTAVAMAMLNDDQRKEMLKVRDDAIRE